MSRYLDPKADIVFKRIFGDHPPILISFLNAVLPLSSDEMIVELAYLPSDQVPSIPDFKRTIADVKCKDRYGRVFIVEVQMNWNDSFKLDSAVFNTHPRTVRAEEAFTPSRSLRTKASRQGSRPSSARTGPSKSINCGIEFKQRLLFGSSQALVKQLSAGEDFKLLQPVYGLGLIAETYEKNSPAWYHHYQLVKKGDAATDVIEHLQLVFIELPKFPVKSSHEKKLRLLWLRFLREINQTTRTVSADLLEVPEIAQAIALSEQAAYTPGELSVYDSYWDQVS